MTDSPGLAMSRRRVDTGRLDLFSFNADFNPTRSIARPADWKTPSGLPVPL